MKAKKLQDDLVARLAMHRGQHTRIARECKIGQATVSRVAAGLSSPTLTVAQRLFDWLDEADKVRNVNARRTKPAQETQNAAE